jgi:4-amino-4-deoxy-L-arabinose transferase-like glycosyltransferase
MTETVRRRWTWVALLGIVLVAATMRVAVIDHGRPYVYPPDEWVIAKAAMRMVDQGSILPPWYYYPSLLNELLVLPTWLIHSLTGASLVSEPPWGLWGMRQMSWSDGLPGQFDYFLAGRWIVALLGIATVPIVFAAGRRVGGPLVGLIAAAILGGSVLHVTHSTFLTTDVPLAFMAAVVLSASIRFLGDRRLRWLALAGVATGLAVSTKYNGAIVAMVPTLAWFLGRPSPGPDPVPLRWALPVAAIAGLIAGVAGTPAFVLDPGSVIAALEFQADGYVVSGLVGNTSEGPRVLANIAYYARYVWSTGLGPAVVLLIAVGVLVAIRRRRPSDVILLAFPAVYLLVASVPLLRFERNLIVMLPFVAILGGIGAVDLGTRLGRWLERIRPGRSWSGVALGAVLGMTALATTPLIAAALTSGGAVDTRTVANEWISSNLRGDARIIRERYTPQVDQATAPTDFATDLVGHPLAWYKEKGYRFIVVSDYAYARYFAGDHAAEQSAYEAIFGLPEVYRVSPDGGMTGPTIRIFRLDPA